MHLKFPALHFVPQLSRLIHMQLKDNIYIYGRIEQHIWLEKVWNVLINNISRYCIAIEYSFYQNIGIS